MPTAEEILLGLRGISNEWQTLAILWHGYFAVLAAGLVLGVRPAKRVAGFLLGLPPLSVSALAWATGNPFNGLAFSLVGVLLLIISSRLPKESIRIAPTWAVLTGSAMFLFGWIYPHFLESGSFIAYLFAAPAGLIPCPTLALVIGLSMILGSFGDRAWSIVLAAAGIFYGIFGAVLLGVFLDWFLLVGAVSVLFAVASDTTANHFDATV